MSKANIIQDLKARGLISQTTPGLEKHLESPRTLYCGFDPTADSLHIGSLVPLLTLRRFQQAGHTPIVVVGGATGMIGDPSFKAQERKLNDEKTIKGWVEKLKKQTAAFLDFGPSKKATGGTPAKAGAYARMANNYDWTHTVDVLSFLRDVGKHFSVNNLISKDAIKSRIERDDVGISYTEFTYPLLQAFDFQQLFKDENCTIQIGGSDQWGNMTAGTELIRKTLQGEAHVLTLPLVTKADGTKFGKTESGTIWLSAEKTSPYAFYQFWLNTADADVEKFFGFFSFKSVQAIEDLIEKHQAAPEQRWAQKALAFEMTSLVHNPDNAEGAQRISEILFPQLTKLQQINPDAFDDPKARMDKLTKADFEQLAQDGLPKTVISKDGYILIQRVTRENIELMFDSLEKHQAGEPPQRVLNDKDGLEITTALHNLGMTSSKREAREFIANGSIQVNGEKITDPTFVLDKKNAKFKKYHLLKRGKKNFALLVLE